MIGNRRHCRVDFGVDLAGLLTARLTPAEGRIAATKFATSIGGMS